MGAVQRVGVVVGLALCAGAGPGCVVGPALVRPDPRAAVTWQNAPASTTETTTTTTASTTATASTTPALARWWTQFDDAMLTALIDDAQRESLSVASADARLRAARAQLTIARSWWWPTVGGSVGASGSESVVLVGDAVGGGSVRGDIGVDAAVDVDVFGGIARGVDAQGAAADAAGLDVDDARVAVAGDMALAYVTLRQLQAERAVAESTLKLQEETAQLVAWRVEQRVAIARAMVTRPRVLLADEPTGNLDSKTSAEIMALLSSFPRTHGTTVLMVTHEQDVAAWAARLVRFVDGRVADDQPNERRTTHDAGG
jgi:outer membrane protein TolC